MLMFSCNPSVKVKVTQTDQNVAFDCGYHHTKSERKRLIRNLTRAGMFWGPEWLAGSVLGSLCCLMQRRGFDAPLRRIFFQ